MNYYIKLLPRSKEEKIIKQDENQLKIKVKEPPIEWKANEKMLKLLSDYLKTPKDKIVLLKWAKSSSKVIKVT